MDTKLLRYLAGFVALSALSASLLYAQEEDVIVLDEVDADSVPIEESILATTRPISSVYGTDRSILDTPRNVNIISREQLDAISIKDVRDFSKLTSSSYTKSNFGAPTTPNLRGQEADLMINGMRRGHSINGNGVPINFNSVESVNIVKGPAGAVYGTSNYVGGYADLITKRAYFQDGGSVGFSYGTFNQKTYSLDSNVVVSDTLAYRTSVQIKQWDGFWDRWYDNSQSVYLTLAWRPSDTYSLDIMGEYYNGNYTENWGINRVTQGLLDDGLYIQNVEKGADYVANYAANPPVGFGNFGAINPDVDNPVPVNRSGKLAAPGDDSRAKVFWLQALQEKKISDSLTLANNSYFHWKDRQTFSSYHYSEYLPDNWSLENRFQLIQDIDTDTFESVTLNYGVRLKYQEIESVNHYFNEPVNYYDMTTNPELFRVPDVSFWSDNTANVYTRAAPRGVLDYWYVGGGQAVDTETFIYAPFLQADLEIDDQFSVLFGYTVDYVEHKQGIPESLKLANNGGTAGFYNGTAYETGFTADDTLTDFDYTKTSSSANFYNANVSLVYKPTEASSVYVTYNEGKHHDSNTGGAVNPGAFDEDLTTELVELGTNISLFDGKAYLGAALFSQEYTTKNQSNDTTDFVFTDGFEIEFNYQPNRNLFATIGYSYLDSERTAAFLATVSPADSGAGGWITPTFPALAAGKYETPGCPPHLLNALIQYKFDNGIGVQANMIYTSSMEISYDGAVVTDRGFGTDVLDTPKLSSQIEFDAKVFYEYNDWLFEFAIFNITDEENWDLPNTGYGLGSVVGRPDRNYEFSATYTF